MSTFLSNNKLESKILVKKYSSRLMYKKYIIILIVPSTIENIASEISTHLFLNLVFNRVERKYKELEI
jgi:hypothetical protein